MTKNSSENTAIYRAYTTSPIPSTLAHVNTSHLLHPPLNIYISANLQNKLHAHNKHARVLKKAKRSKSTFFLFLNSVTGIYILF